MKKIVILFILTLFISCDERSLGKDYYYLPEYDANEIRTGSFIYRSFDENVWDKILIFPTVKKIEFNDNYIIVLQEPNKKLMLKNTNSDLKFWNEYYLTNKKDSLVSLDHKKMMLSEIHNLVDNNKIKRLNKITDSIFKNEIFYKKIFQNKINYYIIQKVDDSIFGPLTLKEFEILKRKKIISLDFE